MTRQTTTSCRSEDGFTLIEVLVSLAILGVSLAVLLGVFSRNLDTTQKSERAMQARVLAQSVLARALAETSVTAMDGTSEPGFAWHVKVSPFAARNDLKAVRLSVTVDWERAGGRHSVSLSTLRFVTREAVP